MKMKAILLLGLFSTATSYSGAGQEQPKPLAGCPAPQVIAASLEKLRDSDWSEVTPIRIQEIWPGPVRPLECKSATSCSSLARTGRIIDGEIECEDVFSFDESAGRPFEKEQLQSVTIHYTAGTRGEIVTVARLLASAAGVPSAIVRTIGPNTPSGLQHLRWQDADGETSSINLQLDRLQGKWKLFLVYTRGADATIVY
jgi:hypothetical protein